MTDPLDTHDRFASLLPPIAEVALIPRIQMTQAFPNFHSAQPLSGA